MPEFERILVEASLQEPALELRVAPSRFCFRSGDVGESS